ncbi:hypothetical protein Cme02nite_10830 [Catellatospora methionotrophica]|uniref:Uncharacterized protein n=1 Tax=Catellatospora methionotrophica TaxID=121620 RepID=A0A8J3PCT1_9ACTN|nr:hypothetical protein Cme02nite_10830 [Catellatospora methionotrophica]
MTAPVTVLCRQLQGHAGVSHDQVKAQASQPVEDAPARFWREDARECEAGQAQESARDGSRDPAMTRRIAISHSDHLLRPNSSSQTS